MIEEYWKPGIYFITIGKPAAPNLAVCHITSKWAQNWQDFLYSYKTMPGPQGTSQEKKDQKLMSRLLLTSHMIHSVSWFPEWKINGAHSPYFICNLTCEMG